MTSAISSLTQRRLHRLTSFSLSTGGAILLLTASWLNADPPLVNIGIGASAAEVDFKPLTAWRGYVSPNTMPDGWKNEDGEISLAPGGKGQFLVSSEEFGNFDLKFEWKISPGGNSGLFYRSDETHASPPHTAPEYQLLDNATHKFGKDPLRSAGACFSIYPVSKDVSRPAGEWNTAQIQLFGNHVEHWLNGEKVVEYELGSDDWRTHAAKSDFATGLDFGRLAKGRIALQGKGDAVWFRKFMVRVLPELPAGGWPDKVLILGNSITLHPPLPPIEWNNNHGMAASVSEKDYVHLLLSRFSQRNGRREPIALVQNIADFERHFDTIDIPKTFEKQAAFQADIVILAIGENVRALATAEDKARFKKAVTDLLVLVKSPNPTQRILVRGSFWPNQDIEAILREVCSDLGGAFVDLSDVAKDVTNRADVEFAKGKFSYFKYPGVGGHPGDKGMAAIADEIWNAWKLLPR